VPALLSYDGRHGDRRYGSYLPEDLGLVRFELIAGRSSQATLLNRRATTVESLYVSASLLHET
jgi:DNA adenine methylase